MAVGFSVSGSIELCPPVPLAQLWELIGDGRFSVARCGIGETELQEFVAKKKWILVPDPDVGTDSQGRPIAVKFLRVKDPDVHSFAVNDRLTALSAWMGRDHEFEGELHYEGDDEGDVGAIEPYEDGEAPEWHPRGG